jgi:poly(A) polymerase
MATTTKQWGVSPPMSVALPERIDNEKTADLIEELKRENNYEGQEETKKRMATLGLLSRTVQEFIRVVSRQQGIPESQVAQFGGKIYPYGSYRLGVYGPGSDIDTLAVAPKHIKRDDFFEQLPPILRREAKDKLGSLVAVPESFVPIIKLVLNDIEIDLIFVAIATLNTIPKDLSLNDNKLLNGLDQAAVRAITGPRVTDEILSLVPEQKTFRTALRAIKLWAQRRAIYANIVGYPGGVAWAMLVARVCQFYPHAVGATIVNKFFFVMKAWKWPNPVMLKEIEQGAGTEKVWNPSIYPGDKKNIMPIITPAYPSMCATYNISKSGKTIIVRELERGSNITNAIFAGKGKWSDLFAKHTFFTQDHKYYLSIIASSSSAEAAKQWSGLVESKVRMLVQQLELQADQISLARPYTKGYKRVHSCDSDAQIAEIKKGGMKYKVEETKTVETTDPELVTTNGGAIPDAKDANTDGPKYYTYTFYIGIDLTASAQKNLNISAAIGYFKSVCHQWANYNPDLHGLDIVPCKGYELPDDLFDKKIGEVKPSKPVKKLKRSFEETGLPNGDARARPNGGPNGVSPGPTAAAPA